MALQVRKSGKSKNRPALSQHSFLIFFLSHSSFGVSISGDIFPPTYFKTGWFKLLISSASFTALWSNQRITFWSLLPKENSSEWGKNRVSKRVPDGLTLNGFPLVSKQANEQVASKPTPLICSGSTPFITIYN